MGHFTCWMSLSLSGIAVYTHRPQGVNYVNMSSNIYYHYTKGKRSDADE